MGWVSMGFFHPPIALATQLYEQVRGGDGAPRAWKLLGVHMTRACVAMALGINERRFCSTGRIDRRYQITGAAPQSHWFDVFGGFWWFDVCGDGVFCVPYKFAA